MLGSLTRELIRKGKYPWCLEEAYAQAQKVDQDGDQSVKPYVQFQDLERRRLQTAWCLAVSLLFTLAYVIFPSVTEMAVGAGIFLLPPIFSFIWFWGASMGSPLKAFEMKLEGTIEILEHSAFSPPRPIHLMMLKEVKQHSYKIISHHYAQYILWAEKEYGKGSAEATGAHVVMDEFFDLFKERGLVATEADYKPHFAEAAERFKQNPFGPPIIGRPGGAQYSLDEAAKVLDVSTLRLMHFVNEGALLARRDGEKIWFLKATVDEFRVPSLDAGGRQTSSA
jgi:hypothetical protein